MKLAIAFVLLTFGLFSQAPQISIQSLQDVNELKKLLKEDKVESLADKFPLVQMNNEWHVSFIGKRNSEEVSNFVVIGSHKEITSVRIPIDQIESLQSLQGFSHIELSRKVAPLLDRVLFDTHVDSVHAGINLPQAYTGKDVYIGVTDWGFDYTSPMFYDTLLQQTRIVAAWDQFKLSGPTPNGYSYGTEYATVQDLLAAGSDTANFYSYATHGSHVSGIAGGSGAGTEYRGIAFESNFLFTTFLADEAAVLDAWEWMSTRAQNDGKRLVVNMSWGLYHMGTNDGTSLLSQAIADYSNNEGVVFVTSGGNNGNVNFHIKKEFANDSVLTRVNFYSYAANANMWGQSLHMWGENGNPFEAMLEIRNGSNAIVDETPLYSTTLNLYKDSMLIIADDTVFYNISCENVNPHNNRPNIRLRVKNTSSQLHVNLKVKAVNGIVHLWNVTELTTNVGNWGMNFSSVGVGSLAGDSNYGIGEPAASTDAISVAAHSSSYINGIGNISGGARASFSSKGPRYDEYLKPDICAPGVSVMSSLSSFTDANVAVSATVDFEGRTYGFGRLSGTSMSSPAVAGIVALILEANPFLAPWQVKSIIETTARFDNYTGNLPPEGDEIWGHGKINAYLAIALARGTVGELDIEDPKMWKIYPNPASNDVTIEFEGMIESVEIISLSGQVSNASVLNNKIDLTSYSEGMYIIRFINEGKVYQDRILVQ